MRVWSRISHASATTKDIWNLHRLPREAPPEQQLCNVGIGDRGALDLQCLSTHHPCRLTHPPTQACEGAHTSTAGIMHREETGTQPRACHLQSGNGGSTSMVGISKVITTPWKHARRAPRLSP